MDREVKYSDMYFDNNESRVFFAVCVKCPWEGESQGEADECATECADCGADTDIGSDYV